MGNSDIKEDFAIAEDGTIIRQENGIDNVCEVSIAICSDRANLFYCAETKKCCSFDSLTRRVVGISELSACLRSMWPVEAAGTYRSYKDFIRNNEEIIKTAKRVFILHDGTSESVAESLRLSNLNNAAVHHVTSLAVLGYVSFMGEDSDTDRVLDIGNYTCGYNCGDGVIEMQSISSCDSSSIDIWQYVVYGIMTQVAVHSGYVRDILPVYLSGYDIGISCEMNGAVRDYKILMGKDCVIPMRHSEMIEADGYSLYLYIGEKKMDLTADLGLSLSSVNVTLDVDSLGNVKLFLKSCSGHYEFDVADLLQKTVLNKGANDIFV